MNGYTDTWTHGQMNTQTHGHLDEWTNGYTDTWTYRHLDIHTAKPMARQRPTAGQPTAAASSHQGKKTQTVPTTASTDETAMRA